MTKYSITRLSFFQKRVIEVLLGKKEQKLLLDGGWK